MATARPKGRIEARGGILEHVGDFEAVGRMVQGGIVATALSCKRPIWQSRFLLCAGSGNGLQKLLKYPVRLRANTSLRAKHLS